MSTPWVQAWLAVIGAAKSKRAAEILQDGTVAKHVAAVRVGPGCIRGQVWVSRRATVSVTARAPVLSLPPVPADAWSAFASLLARTPDPAAQAELLRLVPQLAPGRDEVEFECSCGRAPAPCVHAKLVWLAVSQRIVAEGNVLPQFRGLAGERLLVQLMAALPSSLGAKRVNGPDAAEVGEPAARDDRRVDVHLFWTGSGNEPHYPPPSETEAPDWVFEPPEALEFTYGSGEKPHAQLLAEAFARLSERAQALLGPQGRRDGDRRLSK